MNDNEWDQWKDWMDDQKTALGNPSPHIFTYALGNGADETVPAQLACENDGWFAKVEDGDPAALKHAMIRFYPPRKNTIEPTVLEAIDPVQEIIF